MFTPHTRFKRSFIAAVKGLLAAFLLAWSSAPAQAAPVPAGFTEHYIEVNGVRLHYMIGGSGDAVVLLHGYAETSHMWLPIMPLLARHHTVIVPDMRGVGDSSKPATGYDKKNMAVDIHDLVLALGVKRTAVVGHDIGLMVAYAYAAQFPRETSRVVLMDAFLPGIGDWKKVWLSETWHFHFYGKVPLALVKGRERIYFEHFWNDFAANPDHSIPEADRRLYAKAYAQPGGMEAGFNYFSNFKQDAKDFSQLNARHQLQMPVLVLSGEKAAGMFLINQVRLVAPHSQGKLVKGSGHWLMEEAPDTTIPAIVAFLDAKS